MRFKTRLLIGLTLMIAFASSGMGQQISNRGRRATAIAKRKAAEATVAAAKEEETKRQNLTAEKQAIENEIQTAEEQQKQEERAGQAAFEARRARILRLTQDPTLADVLATSELNADGIEQILAKYDFSKNLEAAEQQKARQKARDREALSDALSEVIECDPRLFPVGKIQVTDNQLIGYVENLGEQGHSRFTIQALIATQSLGEQLVTSDPIKDFEPGERRRLRFSILGNAPTVTRLKIQKCLSTRIP